MTTLMKTQPIDPHLRTEDLHEATPRLGAYRVSGDLEVRCKELEQELMELRAQYREADLARWRALRSAREYKARVQAKMVVSSAGLGAAIASVVALALYLFGVVTIPWCLLAIVASGPLVRVVQDVRKAGIDDNFPDAPPPRMIYGGR